jgi:hypothetical protein
MDDVINLDALFKELESEEWCSAVRPCVGCKGCNKLYGNLLTRIRKDLSTLARISCMYRRRCVNAIASRIREKEEGKEGFTSYRQEDDTSNDHNQRKLADKRSEGQMPADKGSEGQMPADEGSEEVELTSFKRSFNDLNVDTADREQAKAARTLSA